MNAVFCGLCLFVFVVAINGNAVDRNLVKRDSVSQLKEKFAGYKYNCMPLPTGCKCDEGGQLVVYKDEQFCKNGEKAKFDEVLDELSKVREVREANADSQYKANYDKVVAQLKEKFANFKYNCFPLPTGCKCDEGGQLVVYKDEQACRNPAGYDKVVDQLKEKQPVNPVVASTLTRMQQKLDAKESYQQVLEQLKTKFAYLKPNCFPLPVGCRCQEGQGFVVIKDEEKCRDAPHNERSRA